MRKKGVGELISDYLLSLPVAVSLTYNLFGAFLIPKEQSGNFMGLLLYTAIFMLVFHLCFLNKTTVLTTAGLALLSLLVGTYVLIKKPELLSFFRYSTLLDNLFALITFLCCLVVYWAARTLWSSILLFIGGTGVFFYMSMNNFKLSTTAYYLFLVGTAAVCIRKAVLKKLPVRKFRQAFFLTALSTAAAAAVFLLGIFTYNNYVDFENRHSIITQAVNGGDPDKIDMSAFESFQISGHLGVPVKPNKDVILTVKTDAPSFYLKSTTYADYENSSWTQITGNKELGIDNFTNYLWAPTNLYLYDKAYLSTVQPFTIDQYIRQCKVENLIQTKTLTVIYKKDNIKNMFLPLGFMSYQTMGILLQPKSDSYNLSSAVPVGTVYTVEYPQIDPEDSKIRSILENDKSIFSEMVTFWRSTNYKIHEENNDNSTSFLSIGELVPAADFVENYDAKITAQNLQLGSSVTQRTKDLAVSLTKNCKNDFEKVQAIKTYLQYHCTYTLSPPQPPKGKDLVDYFLFESHKGYCVHYATAMTVLLRAANVPARFVSGFVSPETPEDGEYVITNSQAHAWVEVYSHSLGFYTVEATNTIGSQNIPTLRGTEQSSGIDLDFGLFLYPVLGILLLGCLVLGLLRIYRAIKLEKLKKLGRNVQVLRYYEDYLSVLAKFGFTRSPEMTAYEFAESLPQENRLSEDFLRITDIYMQAAYSGAETGSEGLEAVAAFRKALLQHLREYAGLRRYLLRFPWL